MLTFIKVLNAHILSNVVAKCNEETVALHYHVNISCVKDFDITNRPK